MGIIKIKTGITALILGTALAVGTDAALVRSARAHRGLPPGRDA
jgi:hypothetical protein